MKDDTGERLMKIETSLDYLTEKQKENETRNVTEHEEIKTLIKNFIESADNKYANKTVERIVYGLVALIVITVFTLIIKGVLA